MSGIQPFCHWLSKKCQESHFAVKDQFTILQQPKIETDRGESALHKLVKKVIYCATFIFYCIAYFATKMLAYIGKCIGPEVLPRSPLGSPKGKGEKPPV